MPGAPVDTSAVEALDRSLRKEAPALLSEHGVPGLQIAVGLNGRVAISLAFGVASVRDQEPLQEVTVFKAASIAKCATALCVLRLVDRGLVSLDEPFSRYTHWRFPPERCHGHDQHSITIRMLLSHTSGLDAEKFPQIPVGVPAPEARQILDGHFGPSLTPHIRTRPGSELRYAGSNFELLRLIVETVANEPLPVFADREVFGPIGLARTRLGLTGRGDGGPRARPHGASGDGLEPMHYPAIGSSGLYTTAHELARLWLAAGGSPLESGRPLLSGPLHNQMLRVHGTTPQGYRFGLGVALAEWGTRPLFKHAGISRGGFAMAEGTTTGCVVVLCNGDNAKPLVMPLVGRLTGWVISQVNQQQAGPQCAGAGRS